MVLRAKSLRSVGVLALVVLGYFGIAAGAIAQSESPDAAPAAQADQATKPEQAPVEQPATPADQAGVPEQTPGEQPSAKTDQAEVPEVMELEEVVITAQLRKERLQEVPISVQVVSGESLAEENLNSLVSVAQTVPSVYVGGSAGRVNEIVIRGLGGGNTQAFDQPVGIFVDGVYHGRSRITTGTFLDLERVEILKGPQSTFFGNNAIAGAFNIVTRKPGKTSDGWIRALYGEDGQYALEGAGGGPVSDTFGIRGAVTFNGTDGWIENVNTGENQPEQDNVAGRLTFAFNPSDDLEAMLKVEGSRNQDASGLVLQLAGCPAPAPFVPAAGFCAAALGLGVPTGLDIDQNSVNDGQESNVDTAEGVFTVNYNRWGHVFTSITGYHEYQYNLNLDADLTPLSLLHIQAPEEYDQISQEFRIASPTGKTIEYLAGVYFQNDHLDFAQRFNYFFLNDTIASIPSFEDLVPYLPLGQETNYSQTEKSYAVFGSVTWNITDRLSLTGGLRGSWVEKDSLWNQFFATGTQDYGGQVPLPDDLQALASSLPFGLGEAGTRTGSRSDDAVLPSARLQYKVDPDVMLYASYARGFLAGGFNGAGTGADGNEPYDPEYADAYEVGLKSEWFNRKVLLNVSLFRTEYTDLQVTISETTSGGGFINQTRNAAASVSQGVELETRWNVSDSVRLAAAVTYLDAHYESYPNAGLTQLQTFCRVDNPTDPYCVNRFPNGVGPVQDLSGAQQGRAPEWSGSVNGSYTLRLPGDYRLTTDLSAYYSDDFAYNIFDELDFGYTRYDGRLTFEPPGDHWAFDLIGKNLSDEVIPTVFAGQPATRGSQTIQKQQPRNFALQVRYQF
jgi:outer membrane receptor protein involved in Fe transport